MMLLVDLKRILDSAKPRLLSFRSYPAVIKPFRDLYKNWKSYTPPDASLSDDQLAELCLTFLDYYDSQHPAIRSLAAKLKLYLTPETVPLYRMMKEKSQLMSSKMLFHLKTYQLLNETGILTLENRLALIKESQLYRAKPIFECFQLLVKHFKTTQPSEQLLPEKIQLSQLLFDSVLLEDRYIKHVKPIYLIIKQWPLDVVPLLRGLKIAQNLVELKTILNEMLLEKLVSPDMASFFAQAFASPSSDCLILAAGKLLKYGPSFADHYYNQILIHPKPIELGEAIDTLTKGLCLTDLNVFALFSHDTPTLLATALVILHSNSILSSITRTYIFQHTDPIKLAEAYSRLKKENLFEKYKSKLCHSKNPLSFAEALICIKNIVHLSQSELNRLSQLEDPLGWAKNMVKYVWENKPDRATEETKKVYNANLIKHISVMLTQYEKPASVAEQSMFKLEPIQITLADKTQQEFQWHKQP